MLALGAAFCIVGGLTLTAFAQPQAEGDVSYQYYDTATGEYKTGIKTSGQYTPVTMGISTTWGASSQETWYVVSDNTLNIYAQESGTGKLYAGTTNGTNSICTSGSAGIGGCSEDDKCDEGIGWYGL